MADELLEKASQTLNSDDAIVIKKAETEISPKRQQKESESSIEMVKTIKIEKPTSPCAKIMTKEQKQIVAAADMPSSGNLEQDLADIQKKIQAAKKRLIDLGQLDDSMLESDEEIEQHLEQVEVSQDKVASNENVGLEKQQTVSSLIKLITKEALQKVPT